MSWLLGRSLQSRIPKTVDCLEPKWPVPDDVTCQDQEVTRRQKKDFARPPAATVLPPLQLVDTACVLSPASKPCSYVVGTPNAVLVRNRVHLVPYSDPTMSQLNEPAQSESRQEYEERNTE
ncbi:hypothetical protein HPB49_002284 [Dermacentor silvarum]|uniref:Uncharacterized protein n=1 Tax=Dermacentor silvarum TaxID=543639 RepID=A0ACB8DI85_DERSI|nr:hypothetical protein HPB49_002284 [Dermacentor silvarum]